jgi:hypothetical protein
MKIKNINRPNNDCGQINSDRLKKVQLEAARIATGLPSFASINYIYIETGWEKLKTRREVRKLVLFNKIVNGQVPDYLTELVPPTVADANNYNLRNRLNISQPSYRLSTYQQSYFPSTIKLWNTLYLNLRQLPTLPSFNLSMCLVHLQSLLNAIPKCLCVCTGSIVVWSKINVKLHSTSLTLKIIISVLVGLNFNNHLFDHFFRELYHRILLALEAKQVTSVTFADISKAFDTVWVKAL